MKNRALSDSTHARVRFQDLRGAPSQKQPAAEAGGKSYADPTTCLACGAVYSRKTWRQSAARSARAEAHCDAALARCPACEQVKAGGSEGTVLVRGSFALANEGEIRRRALHVAARAGYTQPQRRIVSVRRTGSGLEVTTTSQELAHRLVRELKKAFHGRATYSWSDRDGRLTATWERPPGPDIP